MKAIAMLPARMGSTRFPGKPLEKILGMPMIGHCYHRVKMSQTLDEVVVATCDQEIFDYVLSIGGKAVMTSDKHERCTDRCAEGIDVFEAQTGEKYDILMMVQGDEPLVEPDMLDNCVQALKDNPELPVANLYSVIQYKEEFEDPNAVKFVMDRNENALYFSREPIPSRRKFDGEIPMLRQLGLIGFRTDFLRKYLKLEPTPLEEIESVDMNRVLEHGYSIKMIKTDVRLQAVDVPGEIHLVEERMKNDPLYPKYK